MSVCNAWDDAAVALKGLHRADVWVTRLRAELSADECAAGDLELEPASDRSELPTAARAAAYTDPKARPCGGSDDGDGCSLHAASDEVPIVPAAFALLGLAAVGRAARAKRARRTKP